MAVSNNHTQPLPHGLKTIAQWLAELRGRLENTSDTPSLDAQVLLAHVLGKNRSWVMAHPEVTLNHAQDEALREALWRLEQGQPLPYILGHWEFYGLDFNLTPAVLIPRPETELLVEQALAWLRAHPHHRRLADVGTGCGCIAIALAVHIPDLQVLASDISTSALQVAEVNARKHGVAERVHLIQSDLLPPPQSSPLPYPVDLILANLPYIPTPRLPSLKVSRWEPLIALDGGPDGAEKIRRLLQMLPGKLAPDGLLLMEIDSTQGEMMSHLAQATFPQARVQVLPDLAGQKRCLRVELDASTGSRKKSTISFSA